MLFRSGRTDTTVQLEKNRVDFILSITAPLYGHLSINSLVGLAPQVILELPVDRVLVWTVSLTAKFLRRDIGADRAVADDLVSVREDVNDRALINIESNEHPVSNDVSEEVVENFASESRFHIVNCTAVRYFCQVVL